MEQFVLGIFQEHLSKFIVDFRKEQVNANLLNGKGEITDVELNCDSLNDVLKTVTPYVQLESVHVSKLSFHVTAWANIRKAPILVDVEDIRASLVEPLEFLDGTRRRGLQQLTQAELNELIQKGLHKLRGSYNLFDRIADNLTVEVRSIHIQFQPRGKFKTSRIGEWTPPTILTTLKHVRYVSVNDYGNEASPEEVWRHNKHPHGQPAHLRTFTIFKKLSMQCTMGLCRPGESDNAPPPLVRETYLVVQLCFKKRLRDAAILAVQVDATLSKVEVHVDHNAVPMVAHALAGIQYCVAKDRAFQDPLAPESQHVKTCEVDAEGPHGMDPEVVEAVTPLEQVDEEAGSEDEGDSRLPSAGVIEDNASDISSINDDEADMSIDGESTHSGRSTATAVAYGGNQPTLLLPSGIVIHEALTVTLSVEHCTVRGTYSGDTDGYVQMVVKGLIGELMWPNSASEKGGYTQASLSYISIQERYGPRIRSVLLGGIQQNVNLNPLERSGKSLPERVSDENFPLFEDRCIRNDPLGLRHTFPVQALGLKSTISYIDKVSVPGEQEVMVLQEVGVDQFDILLDATAWCRALRFAMNEAGGGFDERWHSGDWEELLTNDMLATPSQPLDLATCVQPIKELLLDENYMISSDLLNVTARLTNVEVRVPAAVENDVRSSDIIIGVSETMVVVSSALPRTFLSGKIGASIRGDESKKEYQVKFPNDPSDICYSLEDTEDPSIRQEGTMTTRSVSTFRLQLTVRGVSVRIVPVIPFCNAPEPQQLLEPTEMTMIGCFEGEPPSVPDSNLIKIVLFLSLQFHRLCINVDLDIAAGALSTVLSHSASVKETFERLKKVSEDSSLPRVGDDSSDEPIQPDDKIRSSVAGRRVLATRQIQRSRNTGGLSVSFCMQVAQLEFHLWRQNVSMLSRFRASLSCDRSRAVDDTPLPLLKVLMFKMNNMEGGIEFLVSPERRRTVLKSCLSDVLLEVCDFDQECSKHAVVAITEHPINAEEHADKLDETLMESDATGFQPCMKDILVFGPGVHRTFDKTGSSEDILIRIEELTEESRTVSCAVNVGAPGVINLRQHELESAVFLVIEALLMPSGMKDHPEGRMGIGKNAIVFPPRSVGAVLSSVLPGVFIDLEQGTVDILHALEDISAEEDLGRIDRIMLSLVQRLLPGTHNAMLRVCVSQMALFLPSCLENENRTWFGVCLAEASLLSGYFRHFEEIPIPMLSVLADNHTRWSAMFEQPLHGFQHNLQSRQSIHSAQPSSEGVEITGTLVPEFDATGSYHSSAVSFSLGESPLSLADLDLIMALYSTGRTVLHRFVVMDRKIWDLVSALRRRSLLSEESGGPYGEINQQSAPSINDVSPVVDHIVAGRRFFLRLRKYLAGSDTELRVTVAKQSLELDMMRCDSFAKERDRLAALVMVRAQFSGFLRVSGTHMFGQRVQRVTTLWSYFAVLRGSLLILYASPVDSRPIDLVVLDGAGLHPLAGGRRKRDVSQGFSLVEHSGKVRFFLAPNRQEYEVWVQELQKAVDLSSSQEGFLDADCNVSLNGIPSESQSTSGRARVSTVGADPTQQVVDASTRPKTKQQVRQRLSSITASTKNKLGSAVQAARHRGNSESSTDHHEEQDNDDKIPVDMARTTPAADESGHSFPSVTVADEQSNGPYAADGFISAGQVSLAEGSDGLVDAHAVDTENAPKGRRAKFGQRFAAVKSGTKNRLGSAVHAAKEKGKVLNEQRKQRRDQLATEDKGHGDSYPANTHEDPRPPLQSTIDDLDGPPTSQPIGMVLPPSPSGDILPEERGADRSYPPFAKDDPRPDASVPRRGLQLRQRVSKIGSAVKTARRGRSQRGQDDRGGLGLGDAVKLKSIRVGAGHPTEMRGKEGNPLTDVPWRKIRGFWVAQVLSDRMEVELASPHVDEAQSSTDRLSSNPIVEGSSDHLADDTLPLTDCEASDRLSHVARHQGSASSEFSAREVRFERAFRIRLIESKQSESLLGSELSAAPVKDVLRSMADVLHLHSLISEIVSSVLIRASVHYPVEADGIDFSDERRGLVATRLGLTPLETLDCAGSKLGGLLEDDLPLVDNCNAFIEYQCETIMEFLNSMIDCPLPDDAHRVVAHFLEIPDEAGKEVTSSFLHEPWRYQDEHPLPPSHAVFTKTVEALATACDAEFLRAELCSLEQQQDATTERQSQFVALDQQQSPSLPPPADLYIEPLLPSKITDHLHDTMHQALMNAMMERDEAHAQLVATDVLHVHEMQQERKKVERLTHELQAAERQIKAQANQPAGFFSNPGNSQQMKQKVKETERMKEYHEQMIKNTEQELISLCQQLSSEISAKTSKSLEIVRLKDSFEMEREKELREKEALQDELRQCKEQLAVAERKNALMAATTTNTDATTSHPAVGGDHAETNASAPTE